MSEGESKTGWIGFDLDGTLAIHIPGQGPSFIGPPIQPILRILLDYRRRGYECRIFTARVSDIDDTLRSREYVRLAKIAIESWCLLHVGEVLPITCCKDYDMITIYEDRCTQVEHNTGRIIGAHLVL